MSISRPIAVARKASPRAIRTRIAPMLFAGSRAHAPSGRRGGLPRRALSRRGARPAEPRLGRQAFAYTRRVARPTPPVEPIAVNANLPSAPQMREYAEIVATIKTAAPRLMLDWG